MLTEVQSQHAERVRESLYRLLRENAGWLSFERYMDWVLYAPGLGYYSAGARKFGADGDFTTAPEISPLFGACVARQCADVLEALAAQATLPADTPTAILEIGAGSGALAVDVLTRLEQLERLPARYLILDVSADLRERQRQALEAAVPHLLNCVEWLDAPPPLAFNGIILANEVLDALPVARFRWSAKRCEEMGVARRGDELVWEARAADAALTAACHRLAGAAGGWDDGYVSEYCPRLIEWARGVTSALRAGTVMWFDYGLPRPQYYLPERHDGTLLCHFRHRAHADPFFAPGLQDITAWVDFTSLAEATRGTSFELGGFTTQAHFLAGLRIDREMQRFAGHDARRFAYLAQAARTLLLPGEMGERFKVMAWTRALDIELAGFASQDLRHTL